ncbi:hypothetical protein Plhal304r1_c034g0107591 [Plasmopara halstedii]
MVLFLKWGKDRHAGWLVDSETKFPIDVIFLITRLWMPVRKSPLWMAWDLHLDLHLLAIHNGDFRTGIQNLVIKNITSMGYVVGLNG